MDWLVYVAIGLGSAGVGAGVTWYAMTDKKQPVEQIAKAQIEVQKNLTEPDLLEVPCSIDFIKEYGEGLCREMFCRMTTRGIDSKTSGSECESISNTINKTLILDVCGREETPETKTQCIEFFDRRM